MNHPESQEIIQALRSGLVPRRGLHHFAVGLEPLMEAIEQELGYVATGKGTSKWLRGEYGTGKTFATRLLGARARRMGFATAEVQVSLNDTPLHHLETVYRRLIERLETEADGSGAFKAIVEGWLYQVGEEVARLRGIDEDDPSFADATEERLEDKLADLSRHNPAFAQALRGYHRALHEGNFATAQGILAWLAGQPHTDRSITRIAGLSGKVDGQAALTFLAGLLRLLRQSGYKGLVVVLDEVETVQRMPSNSRASALNALRQLMDMLTDDLPGMYLVVTGTRDFFEGYKGLKSLPPLYQRVSVSFGDDPRWDNLRAPQVRLLPFDRDKLVMVGRSVRDLYPAKYPERITARVEDRFLEALVERVTDGFGGKIEVAPRLFLRELTDVLDRVDQHADFEPAVHYRIRLEDADLTPSELAARHGMPDPGENPGPTETPDSPPAPVSSDTVTPHRLDD